MVTEVCIMKVDFEVSWVSETSETNLLGCSGQELGTMMIVNGFFYTCCQLPILSWLNLFKHWQVIGPNVWTNMKTCPIGIFQTKRIEHKEQVVNLKPPPPTCSRMQTLPISGFKTSFLITSHDFAANFHPIINGWDCPGVLIFSVASPAVCDGELCEISSSNHYQTQKIIVGKMPLNKYESHESRILTHFGDAFQLWLCRIVPAQLHSATLGATTWNIAGLFSQVSGVWWGRLRARARAER